MPAKNDGSSTAKSCDHVYSTETEVFGNLLTVRLLKNYLA